jgi:uncharacterized membrane protein YesL
MVGTNGLQESKIVRILTRVFDLLVLNALCIITSIPLVTVGASLTALYSVTMKMQVREEGYIIRDYFRAFLKNLKKSVIEFLMIAITQAALAADILVTIQMQNTVLRNAMAVLICVVEVLWFIIAIFVFPITAVSDKGAAGNIIDAVIIPVSRLQYALPALMITAASIAVTLLNATTIMFGSIIWILIGIAAVAYANAGIMRRVLQPFYTL